MFEYMQAEQYAFSNPMFTNLSEINYNDSFKLSSKQTRTPFPRSSSIETTTTATGTSSIETTTTAPSPSYVDTATTALGPSSLKTAPGTTKQNKLELTDLTQLVPVCANKQPDRD